LGRIDKKGKKKGSVETLFHKEEAEGKRGEKRDTAL
jgi:hypothetical protein